MLLLSNRTKICYLRDRAKATNPSMIVITESWLHEGVLDAEITIPDYVLYRADRDASRTHGGCAMWVRCDLASKQVVSHSNAWVETLIVKIKTLDTLVLNCELSASRLQY